MKFLVSYENDIFNVWTDGAGLDMDYSYQHEQSRSELFSKVVNEYSAVGLEQALVDAGAIIVMEIHKADL